MKKSNLLNQSEEKLIFPVSRTSGRIFGLILFLVISGALIYFLFNSTPTNRREVTITKNELLKNKIDTSTTKKVTELSCETGDEANEYAKLQGNLSNAKWAPLMDTIEMFDGYETKTVEDPWYGSYERMVPKYRKELVKNNEAIPNKLNSLYESKGIDSTMSCEKAEILKSLNKVCEMAKLELKENAFENVMSVLYSVDKLTSKNTEDAINIWKKVNLGKSTFESWSDLTDFRSMLSLMATEQPSESRVNLINNLIDENEKQTYPLKKSDQDTYSELPMMILGNKIPDDELATATADFLKDIQFHDEKGFVKSANKYYRLFNEKWNVFENQRIIESGKKSGNRVLSSMVIGGGILALLLLSVVLLLFAINKTLSNKGE
jgi:hypothetical protein